MKKIFLLGSERSGSNLLRTLLGNHTNISAPVALHLSDLLSNYYRSYFPLNDHGIELIDKIKNFVNHPFNEWNIEFDAIEFYEKFKPENFIELLNAVYTQKSLHDNTEAYFCKDNHNHNYALGIAKNFPDTKFIYLMRDPRDHVASWLRNKVHLHTPYKIATKWKTEQDLCLKLHKFYGLDMVFVRYEDLVSQTEDTMENILKFLELPIESNCFQTNKQNKEASKMPHWKNLNKPVMKDNYGKYRDVLSGSDLELVETVCKKEMEEFKYPFVTEMKWNKGNHYFFYLKEEIRDRISRKRNKQYMKNEMSILLEKGQFVKNTFK